jgi:hypothetical protein
MSCTLTQLRLLVDLQADDEALWSTENVHIETAYVQQSLRWLTHAIEGTWTFEEAKAAMIDCYEIDAAAK